MELFNSLFFVNLYFAVKLVLSLLSIPFAIYIYFSFFKDKKLKQKRLNYNHNLFKKRK